MGYAVTSSIGGTVGVGKRKKGFTLQINAFVSNPEMVAQQQLAAKIAAEGLMNDWFTQHGKLLSDYVTDKAQDYKGARRLVNGQNKAKKIANLANAFLTAKKDCP